VRTKFDIYVFITLLLYFIFEKNILWSIFHLDNLEPATTQQVGSFYILVSK
jgi:hypothetical protein